MGCESSRRMPPREARKEEGSINHAQVEEHNVRAVANPEYQEPRAAEFHPPEQQQIPRIPRIPQENDSDVVNSE